MKNWDRKLNDTDANDDGEDNATAHLQRLRSTAQTERAHIVLFLAHFITLTLDQV